MVRFLVALFALILCIAPAPQAVASSIVGTASVIDGDTIEIHGQRIRLFGIDAPEGRQTCLLNGAPWRCGAASANALSKKIGRAPVSCEERDVDRYGRIVAVCSQHDSDLNAWMVAEGWAVAYRTYSRAYVPMENDARRAKRGLWAGEFDMPWDWRRNGSALPASPAAVRSSHSDPSRMNLLRLAASYSCSPKRTCPKIGSCDEARWLLANCTWGGNLDRDGDGVPCETLCPGG